MIDHSVFSTKESYNESIRHFKTVKELVRKIQAGSNPGDLLSPLLESGTVKRSQIPAICSAVLCGKFGYGVKSVNLRKSAILTEESAQMLARWRNIDLCLVYFENDEEGRVLNPKNPEQVRSFPSLQENNLLVVYALSQSQAGIGEIAAADFLEFVHGAPLKECADYTVRAKTADSGKPVSGSAVPKSKSDTARQGKEPGKKTDQIKKEPGKNKRSQQVGVTVSNELFHNGNVEAWKKILQSYHHTYKENTVNVYYDKEIVTDLNSLFEWGKVKRGTCILFDITGPEIHALVKLKNYLYEGASPRFEKFLIGQPNTIIKLF